VAQLLPKDETFQAPDWSGNTTTPADWKSPPWYYYYIGFSPSKYLDTGGTYPLLIGGKAPCIGTSALMTPAPDSNTALNCVMTDPNGSFVPETPLRAVLCREEDSFEHDTLNVKVTFGLEVVGGAGAGYAFSGGGGTGSPTPGGGFSFPRSPTNHPTSQKFHTGMSPGHGGTWTAGGGLSAQGSDSSPINPWPAWRGNAIFVRAGGGVPIAVNGATESPFTDANNTKRLWYYGCVDHYAFIAYPSSAGGSATAPDLKLEIWQVIYTNPSGTLSNTERLLMAQSVSTGATDIDFRQPFHMRLVVANDGSVNPTFEAYIGKYIDSSGVVHDEVQCFKDGVFSTTSTYPGSPGTDVTHNSTTGLVTDEHSTKITDTENKTIGFATATDANVDVSAELGATDPVFWATHTGVYEIDAKDVGDRVKYNDVFERVVEGVGRSGRNLVVNNLVTMTGIQGAQANGMFTFDGYAKQLPVSLSSSTLNLNMVRQSLLWTDGPAVVDDPNDYVRLDYDYDNAVANRPYNVMRPCVMLRPSTQLYNHHRAISFMVGSDGDHFETASYEVGIFLRGYFEGYNLYGLCCYVGWTTDNAQSITSAHVTLAYRNCLYSTTNPESNADVSPTPTTVIARKSWATGTAGGFANLYDTGSGSFKYFTLDVECESYDQANSPSAAGLYKVKWGEAGSEAYIELDDQTAPYQGSTSSPYTVVEPDPVVSSGRAEGFWFLCNQPQTTTGPATVFEDFRFKDWKEGTISTDPGGYTAPDAQDSVAVSGEGTPVGSLNVTGGALAIAGEGIWDVEAEVDVEFFYPIRKMQFDSGHTYGSPLNSENRRRWRVRIKGMDLTVYQSLQTFFNSHNGPEIPFSFKVPIPDDGTASGSTAEATETVSGWFSDDTLVVDEITYQTYDVAFSVEELLVT